MKKYKLNDVCLKITDGSHFSPKAVDFGYPMYSVKDMNEFGFNDSDYKMISEDDFKSLVAAGCRPQKDDVLIAKDGSYLKYAFVCKEEKDEVILSSIAILRPNKDIIDPTFFSFLLRNPSVKKSMKYYVSGTALPRIVLDNFKKMEINIPGLSEQKKIGDMLSTLDKRIENLRAQNRVLEQTAKTIYDYTFLQCAAHQTTYNKTLNRNIPAGWEVKKLSEIANITMGQSPEGSSYNEIGNGKIFYQGCTDFGVMFPTPRLYTTAPTRFAKVNDILMSVRAPVGTLNIANTECCIGRGLAALNAKEGSNVFLYYVMKNFENHFKNAFSMGTTFGSITKNDLYDLPVLFPDSKPLELFSMQVSPLFKKQLVNLQQIETLTIQRNTLLPLLMTGQIKV